MGISATQFWNQSKNGKAMLVMLVRSGYVELARDICDWLVVMHNKDLTAEAVGAGATLKQAQTRAENVCQGLFALVHGMNDRNAETNLTQVVDHVFQRHYNAGQPQYVKAMAWLADTLRQRVKD